MGRVPTRRVRDRQPAHELRHVVVTLRPKNEMPVIGQDTPGQNSHGQPLFGLPDHLLGAVAVGVEGFGDPAVLGVVDVLDRLDDGAAVAEAVDDFDEAVAVVPEVFGDLPGGDVGPLGAIASSVILVVVRSVRQQLVVIAGDVAGVGAIAVGVVGVGLAVLTCVRCREPPPHRVSRIR